MADWVSPIAIHSVCCDVDTWRTRFIDGNTDTYWSTHINHLHWIIIDLGVSRVVEQIRVYLKVAAACKWDVVDVYVSDDPEDWGAAVAMGLSLTTINSWNERDVTDKTGRYIKLESIDTQASTGNSCYGYEFEALTSALPYQANYEGGAVDVATRDNVALAIIA